MAELPTGAAEGAERRRPPAWLGRALPGALAAALFAAFALGQRTLGPAYAPLLAALALALAAAAAARPRAREALRAAASHPALPHYAALAAALAAGAFLRTWGLRFGLPYFDHPDEWAVGEDALRMLRTGDYSPFSYTYPTLYTYMQTAVAAAHFLAGAGAGRYRTPADIDQASFYVWARALTALLGTATVALTYLAARRLYGRGAALAAAALVAVIPAATADSHYITVDTPATFFTTLALLAAARLALPPAGEPASRRALLARALLAGAAAGLAAATKYNAAVAVAPVLLACALAGGGLAGGAALALTAVAGAALGFTVGTPLWLRELPRLVSDLAGIAYHYKVEGHPGAESSRPLIFYLGALQADALLASWVMLAGLALAFVRRSRADLIVLALVVPYALQLAGVRVVFVRNAVPLLPPLCALAGAAAVALGARLAPLAARRGPRAAALARLAPAILTLAVALQPLAEATRDEWLRAQPTTRILATEWVLANAPDGARVWLEDQTLILPARLRVLGGRPVTERDPAWYREQGFRFLVVSASSGKNDPAKLAAFGEPAARFEPGGVRHGPSLLVFDTGAGDVSRDPRTPSGATLGGGAIVLDGYRHPESAAPGSTMPLALYWRAASQPGRDYTVFVHLLDDAGGKVAQRDLPPLEGSRPTSSWRAGELLRDDQDLPIPAGTPPGRYRLVVGMYDSQTFQAITDGGPIAVGTVEVR